MDNIESSIAIIGMSGRFPRAKNIDEFWKNLTDGKESITFFSDEELLAAGISSDLLNQPNYVKAKGALDDIAGFDASFFSFTPKEAEITDPQQRLFLECAWTALENAGYDPKTYAGEIGIYGSVGGINTYLNKNLMTNPKVIETVDDYSIMLSNDKDFLCTRIAYKLNLTGPAITVQTACSSSLVAIVMACQSLLHYQSDMVLAGGVALTMPTKSGYLYQEGMILSPDGHCRAFDAKAKGTVSGNGAGIVILKRMEDALVDGDHIYAVIKGSHINNDGASKMSFTAPSVERQAKVIEEALAIADISPETVTYVATHGTGTALGDPIEIAALTQAFNTKHKNYCAIGSVKTNIGHLDTAAGVTNLITAALALKYQSIPPSLHFENPNPEIDFANSPFYVNTELTDWQTDGIPRRAGVSSFGIGGTNAHIVLEEAPPIVSVAKSRPTQLLPLSAKTDSALEAATNQLIEHLQLHPDLNLADVAYTYQIGRRNFEQRGILIGNNIAEITSCEPITATANAMNSVVFMFSGQGSQYVNMGLELYQTETVFREQVDYCCQVLQPYLGVDLRSVLYPVNIDEDLNQTVFSQPALFVVEYALAKLWMSWGICPSAMIGHSIGEYVAACLAGVFTLDEALPLVAVRGRLMQSMPHGSMLAVPLAETELRPLLNDNIDLAVINVTSQCVVSGDEEVIEQFSAQLLAEQGLECRTLHTSHAFHSAMMEPILPMFLEQVQRINLQSPQIPYLSNVTGTWIKPEEAIDPSYWVNHLRQTVRFTDGLQELVTEPKYILLEVGPGRTLSTFAKRHPDKVAGKVLLTSLRHPNDEQSDSKFLINTLGQLWLNGMTIDWTNFYVDEQRRRLPLPSYPFERQKYWVDSLKLTTEPNKSLLPKKSDVADWFYIPSWKRSDLGKTFSFKNKIFSQKCWLIFIDECGLGTEIEQKLKQLGQDVITVRAGQKFVIHNEYSYSLNPEQQNDYDVLFKTLNTLNKKPKMIVHLWRVTTNNKNSSTLDCLDKFQNLGFYSLFFLAQTLGKQSSTDKIDINVISNNMQEVIGETWLSSEKATLLGAVKVIPQEYNNINCRSIDIVFSESNNYTQLLEQLLKEFAINFDDVVVAYRNNHRWIQTFEPIKLNETSKEKSKLKKHGVYLITGGFGGIGFTLAEHLAKTIQAKIVLIGRSIFPSKEEWIQWLNTHDELDNISQKIRKLQEFENHGAEILTICADVIDLKQMQTAFKQAKLQFGQINGVIHAVGVIDYAGVIQKRTREINENALESKVKGTLVIDYLLQDIEHDFFILCSSIGSVLYHTSFGQIGYSAANNFLDAFAYHRKLKNSKSFTAVINWTDWLEVGMSVEAQKKWKQNHELSSDELSEFQQYAISPTEGIEIFRRFLENNFTRVIVSMQDLRLMIERDAIAPPTFLIPSKDIEPSKSVKHQRPMLATAYAEPQNDIEQLINELLQEYLGIEKVGIHDDFFELGGDSLLAIQIVSKLSKIFKTNLSSSSLINSPTIVKLAKLVKDTTSSSIKKLPSSLVQLQPGNDTKQPFFLVHPISGHIFHFRELTNYLNIEQPFYGLQAQGLEGETEPLTNIEDMASLYIKALRFVQPEGPYFLGGYSFGGSVVLEMARQLQAANQEIALLVFIDVIGPDQLSQWPVKLEEDWETQLIALLIEESYNFTFWLEQLRTFDTYEEQILYFLEQGKHNKMFPSTYKVSDVENFLNVVKANFQAMFNYNYPIYENNVVLFKAKGRSIFNPENPELSLAKIITGGIDVHEIPGNHFTIIEHPNVEILARHLMVCIDEVIMSIK